MGIENIRKAFINQFGYNTERIEALEQSGSDRKYFRCFRENETYISVYNEDVNENELFINFTQLMDAADIRVPQILGIEANRKTYFLNDLGKQNLLDLLVSNRSKENPFPEKVKNHFKEALSQLVKIQLKLHDKIDYKLCKPYSEFNSEVIQRDLNYFKDWFLIPSEINFEEEKLKQDFHYLETYLLENIEMYFMYRDFQSRNIMIYEDKAHFIDYQGGMKGPLQYDVVSLLYQAKAEIPQDDRNELLEFYLEELQQYIQVNRKDFKAKFQVYALIRMLQTLGAYGRRGWHEKKKHFLESIPLGIKNIQNNYKQLQVLENTPCLLNIIEKIIQKYSSNA